MPEVTRRTLFGTAAGLGLVGVAHAAEPGAPASGPQGPGQQEPARLLGTVTDGHVILPPLHAQSEQQGSDAQPMPAASG